MVFRICLSLRPYVVVCSCEYYQRMSFYAVARGKVPGIYQNWSECQENVRGFKNCVYKKFPTVTEAKAFMEKHKVLQYVAKNIADSDNGDVMEIRQFVAKHSGDPDPEDGIEVLDHFVTGVRKHSRTDSTDRNQCPSKTLVKSTDTSAVPAPGQPLVNTDNQNHTFDFASFAQRLSNLENLYQERIRTLEERVDALEAVRAFEKSNDDFDGEWEGSKESTPKPKRSDAAVDAPNVNRRPSSDPNSTYSSRRRKLLSTALEPVPVLRQYGTSAVAKKRSGDPPARDDELPTKVRAVVPFDDNVMEINKIYSVPFRKDSEGYVEAYTDGACANNGRVKAKAGVGVWFNDRHPLNVSKPVHGRPTNNNAEIQAATWAVRQAASAGIKKLCILTDSMFTINCMTVWAAKWKKNDWQTATGEPVKNKEELQELLEECKKFGGSVKWTHVRGHRGIHGNECADALAREGAEDYQYEKISTAQ